MAAYSSEILSSVIMGGHGGMQADKVLEKELRFLHLTGNRKSTKTLGNRKETSKPTSAETHVF